VPCGRATVRVGWQPRARRRGLALSSWVAARPHNGSESVPWRATRNRFRPRRARAGAGDPEIAWRCAEREPVSAVCGSWSAVQFDAPRQAKPMIVQNLKAAGGKRPGIRSGGPAAARAETSLSQPLTRESQDPPASDPRGRYSDDDQPHRQGRDTAFTRRPRSRAAVPHPMPAPRRAGGYQVSVD